jgi:hypothetical protein
MTTSQPIPSSSDLDNRRIDKLVAGELPEDERRALLLQLEARPDGWRQCALAFLEAQMWREAFAPLGAAADADRLVQATMNRVSKSAPARRMARWSALAACIAAAFILGRAMKQAGPPSTPTSEPTRLAAVVPTTSAETQTDIIPTPVAYANPSPRDATKALLESMVASYEQHGYASEREKKAVKVKLEDGREYPAQAEVVRFHFVGDRTY